MGGPRIRKEIKNEDGFRLVGGLYSSFLIYHPTEKKNVRVSIAPTQDKEKAEKQRNAHLKKLKISEIRAKKRFEFLQKFSNQEKLFESFTEYRQKAAKNSWQDETSRINQHILPFFIGQLSLNHPSQWFEYWREFHKYLSNKTPIRKNTKSDKLSVNSRDNIVRAANAFISFVEMQEDGTPLKRLPEFRFEEKGTRGIQSVYSQAEIDAVIKSFEKINESKYATLFRLLSTTGMRASEGIGLMYADVIVGEYPNQEKWIFKALQEKTEMYGYILLKSQPLDENHLVIDGEAKRKPLKKRKKITPEYNRTIPLIDKKTTEDLVDLKKQVTQHKLLFEGCTYRKFYFLFNKIKSDLKLPKERDIHSLRHTFATRFTELCDGDPRIVEKVIGHSDPKMTARYNHLAAELEAEQKAHSELIRPLKVA